MSSLFPQNVADRLMEANDAEKKGKGFVAPNRRLKSFLTGDNEDDDQALQPIADLFPDCTVMFADISGFTAWSSTRDPAQVFILLQTVYQAFDVIAKRRKVFKVETIGDSYMAVTGLPEPQANHAVLMARYVLDLLRKPTNAVVHSNMMQRAQSNQDFFSLSSLVILFQTSFNQVRGRVLGQNESVGGGARKEARAGHLGASDALWNALWSSYSGRTSGRAGSLPVVWRYC